MQLTDILRALMIKKTTYKNKWEFEQRNWNFIKENQKYEQK